MHQLIIFLFALVNVERLATADLHRAVSSVKPSHTNDFKTPTYNGEQHVPASNSDLGYSSVVHTDTDRLLDDISASEQQSPSRDDKQSAGEVVFNTHHFTQFLYGDDQVYIYSPQKNIDNTDELQRLAFYYIPVLQPVKVESSSQWVWVHKNEVRVRLALGTPDVEKAARKAIADQYDNETASQYSNRWVVAPLMMDSLSAYIVTVSSSLVEGVAPFHVDNPISNTMIFRFACETNETAQSIAHSLLEGDYDIEVSFYFAGMHTVKTNMISITATQLQSVLSKTIADGGGTTATYIHRDQASSFVAKYMANVKKMIYVEDSTANLTLLTNGLEEQFMALFQEGVENSKETQIQADVFGQVWQSTDLNPDRITSEMSKMFTFNESETNKHKDGMNYYNVNQRKDSSLSVHTAIDVRVKALFVKVDTNVKVDFNKKNSEEYERTSHNTVSETDIKKAASQASIEGAWEGEKFIPKSFKVFQLTDAVSRLQIALISKQLSAEKANGAVIRKVGALTSSTGSMSVLTGEIRLYAGVSPPSYPWLVCDGAIVARSDYPRLFSIIGTTYGEGNDSTTFRLPDLRGRVPIGVDSEQLHMENATDIGSIGGSSSHTLVTEELPEHSHDFGTLENSNDGVHTHGIHDPGHNHGGQTGSYYIPSTSTNYYGTYHYQSSGYGQQDTYSISTDYTRISLTANGNHTHHISGNTGAVGQNKPFTVVPPYQVFQYIIYAGE